MSIYRGPGGAGDATNDATSQSIIATQAAFEAAQSAAAAAASEVNAAASEVAASNSEDAAAISASLAASSATSAANALDEFTDLYLGAKTTDPSVDNDDNSLQTGALYFNTVANEFRVWTGTYWQVIVIGAIGDSVILQSYSGDGVETEFTLSTEPFSENVVLVFINGTYQQKNTYSISGLTLTFSEAPPLGTDNIEVSIITMADLSSLTAGIVNLEDADDYYESNTVEGALQEVGRKLSETISVKDFGAVGDGVTDDTAAIQAAISKASSLNGSTVFIPSGTYKVTSTLNINSSNIRLVGNGGDYAHDGGSDVDAASKLVWAGSTNGTFISIVSPSGPTKSKITGCGVLNIELEGANNAGVGIFIKSLNNGIFENIMLSEFRLKALEMTCYVSGTELAEAADNQGNKLRNITARNLLTGSGVGFWFDGSSNANTSFNQFESLVVQHKDAEGFIFANADNNVCIGCRAFRPSGTKYSFEFYGATSSGSVGGNTNFFIDISYPSTYGVILRGTTSGYTSGSDRNVFIGVDTGNGSQVPVAETGSVSQGMTDTGIWFNTALTKVAITDYVSDAVNIKKNMGTESVKLYNTASNHARISDGVGNEWGFNIDGSTGNIRLIRVSGSGILSVQQSASILGNLTISPSNSVTPTVNGQLTFEATNNTTVTVKLKGSDGVVRSATLTLS